MSFQERETLYETIYRLHVVEGLSPADVRLNLSARASGCMVRQYVNRAREVASRAGVAVPPLVRKSKGGYGSLQSSVSLSPMHRAIGVRLNLFRTVTLGDVPVRKFSETYQFANPIRIRQMEAGLYDFRVSEVIRIAEIIGMSVEDLTKPLLPVTCERGH